MDQLYKRTIKYRRLKFSKLTKYILFGLFFLAIIGVFFILFFKEKNRDEIHEIIEKKDYNIKINYPILHIKNLDQEIEKLVKENRNNFMKEVKKKNNNETYEYLVQYEKTEYKNIKNIHIYIQSFTGGAHYTRIDKGYHYNVEKEQLLTIDNILKDNTKTKLSELSYYYAMQYGSDNKIELNDAAVKEGTSKQEYNLFSFNQEGLEIIFPPYQQTSWFDHEIKITIPYEKANSILKEEYQGKTKQKEELPKLETDKRDLNQYKDKKLVALTFDDGPGGKTTEYLLNGLKERDARVTFFALGNRAEQFPNIIKKAYQEGHEIGIHTYSHKNLFLLTDFQLIHEINDTNDIIERIIGKRPTLIRPPYGNTNNHIKELGNMNTILWDIDTEDWRYKDKHKVANEVLKYAQDGDIILFHDIYQSSIEGALLAIDNLKDKGYAFVTISEMLEIKGITLEQNKSYFHFRSV